MRMVCRIEGFGSTDVNNEHRPESTRRDEAPVADHGPEVTPGKVALPASRNTAARQAYEPIRRHRLQVNYNDDL